MRARPIYVCVAVLLLLGCGFVYRTAIQSRLLDRPTRPRDGQPVATQIGFATPPDRLPEAGATGTNPSHSRGSGDHETQRDPLPARDGDPHSLDSKLDGGTPSNPDLQATPSSREPDHQDTRETAPDKISSSDSKHAKRILKQEMVLVPAGAFRMGIPTQAMTGPFDDLHGERSATTNAFWIDKYEVTNAMFKEFLDATGYRPKKPDRFLRHWRDGAIPDGAENKPVRYVSAEDAEAYATWMKKRLPTQEEWEKAARGTDGRTYPWGITPDPQGSRHVFLGVNVSQDQPVDADSFAEGASPYGVLNMEGNILEWTTSRARCVHPRAREFDLIVRRGASPPSVSMLLCPDSRYPDVGFRCVADAPPDDSQSK